MKNILKISIFGIFIILSLGVAFFYLFKENDSTNSTENHNLISQNSQSNQQVPKIDEKVIRKLKARGIEPDMYDDKLRYAIKNFEDTLFDLLIDAGTNINKPDKDGVTPIMYSVIQGNKRAYNILRKNPSIELNKADAQGRTILHFCALEDQKLYEENPTGETGGNSIYSVGWSYKKDFISDILKDSAIERNKIDIYGRTPLDYAKSEDYIDLMIDYGCLPSDETP